MKLNY